MESDQSFSLGWGNHGSAYDEQVHGLFEGASQLASSSSAFGTSYQIHPRVGIVGNVQAHNDIPMEDYEAQEQPAPSAVRAPPETAPSRRTKSQHHDWDAHKALIKRLYIDQNKSLPETMEAMERLHSFKAS